VTGALAALPALPLHEAGKYVAAAYIVVFAVVLIYVAIMAVRLSRMQRELAALVSRERAAGQPPSSAAGESTLP
jgi:hypothetical protein